MVALNGGGRIGVLEAALRHIPFNEWLVGVIIAVVVVVEGVLHRTTKHYKKALVNRKTVASPHHFCQ